MTDTTDFWVGDRFVRPELGEIQLGPERVHLEPRSMEVLLAMARRPGEVLPKQELIDAVWGEAFVSDEVLTHAIWDLRRAFGDNASDPEFIQTIPKKGYRLIAPVKPMGRPRRRATDREAQPAQGGRRTAGGPRRWRNPLLGLLAVLALVWIGLQTRDRPATPDPPSPRTKQTLLLTVSEPDAPRGWGDRLEASLGRQLAGTDLAVVPVDSCAGHGVENAAYCLEGGLQHREDRYAAVARLFEQPAGALAYATSAPVRMTGEDLEAAAAEIGDQVRTFFEVVENPFFHDPDIEPWFSLQKHDVRAIRDFLLGLAYVYRNEIGGRHSLETAVTIDSEFIAPRVFRTPGLVQDGDPQVLAAHRAALDGLYQGADTFEKPMVKWAVALIENDRAEQIQQLRIALDQVGSNRQLEYVLGITLAGGGALDQAWQLIGPLLGQRWRFPGLYSGAAELAILRGRIDDIRDALELALEVQPVDPEVLAVKVALAIYDEDAETEATFRRRLELRRRELASEEGRAFTVPGVTEALAARADGEGRAGVADRLRESAS